MTASGAVDDAGVLRLMAHFESVGCDGVVVAGTNGEGPSLSAVEKRDLARVAVKGAGRLKVLLGIATPSLTEAIWLSEQAGRAGAHGVLLMPPAYFSASEEGIEGWFRAVLDASPLPVTLYNFPQRTGGLNLAPAMLARLSDHPQVAGLKDSSGLSSNLAPFAAALPGKSLLVGDETLLPEALAAGWSGTISGAANVLSPCLRRWLDASGADRDEGWKLLLPALQAVRSSPQPGAHKALLHAQGILPTPSLRLPLLPPSPDALAPLTPAFRRLG